jgi:thiamine-phosphate pyrophosphorylase
MAAGENGADYIAFSPVGDMGLGDDIRAERDLFAWWSEMIELPVVAEGGLDTA